MRNALYRLYAPLRITSCVGLLLNVAVRMVLNGLYEWHVLRQTCNLCSRGVFCWFSLSLLFLWRRFRWAAAAIVPVTCPVHATCIHETDLQSVWPGVLSLDMGPMCVTLGFNVILAVVR